MRLFSPPSTACSHFFEKFLFYRGIGNFPLPFEASFSDINEIEMTNTGTDPIASVFLVIGDGTPESVRFSYLSSLEGGETSQFTLTGTSGSFDELLAAVTQSLVETGLYQKEAESMVATWKDSWFLEPGTRLFYVVPERDHGGTVAVDDLTATGRDRANSGRSPGDDVTD